MADDGMTTTWHLLRDGQVLLTVRSESMDGRQTIHSVEFTGYPDITPADLRSVPWSEVEAKAQAAADGDTWAQRDPRDSGHWPPEEVPSASDLFISTAWAHPTDPFGQRERVQRPDSKPFPSSFYESVAVAYRAYLLAGARAPAARIADESGAPVRTVHTWVQGARERGYLGPGRQGKVGI